MVRQGWQACFCALVGVIVIPAFALAQGGPGGGFGGRGGGGFGGRGGGGMFGPPGALGMLMQPAIQDELKLTEDQRGALGDSIQEAMESMRGSFGNFRDMSDEERQAARDKMREEREKLEGTVREKIMGVLNSEQSTRFTELEFQFLVQQGDYPRALKNAGITLTAEQEEALKTKQESVAKRIQEEIAKVRAQGTKEVLADIVTETQMDKLMGKPFAFEMGRGPGGPGGGPGGPGGPNRGERPRRPPAEDGNDDGGSRRRRD